MGLGLKELKEIEEGGGRREFGVLAGLEAGLMLGSHWGV